MKRVLSIILAIAMMISMMATTLAYSDEETPWWEEEYWEKEMLVQYFNAEPPVYNSQTGEYEIYTPEQLLFLSGNWSSEDINNDGFRDAPRYAYYRLMNDIDMGPLMDTIGQVLSQLAGVEIEGYMPPLSADKDEDGDPDPEMVLDPEIGPRKEYGWFLGTFDGNYHAIKNVRIFRAGKYVALFGYIGYQNDRAYCKNLAIIDIEVEGEENVGGLVGVTYGTITNCMVTGKMIGTDDDTAGGIAGKIKEGEGPVDGYMENVFSYVDIDGQFYTGGILGIQDGGGTLKNAFAGGTLIGANDKGYAGGIAGGFNAGEIMENCIAIQSKIHPAQGAGDSDKLIGGLAGESGKFINNNYAWEGTDLRGNEPTAHPNKAINHLLSAEEIMTKSTYINKLGWTFDNDNWGWVGQDNLGYPMLQGFINNGIGTDMLDKIAADLEIKVPTINMVSLNTDPEFNHPQINKADLGADVSVAAQAVLPAGKIVDKVELFYGDNEDGSTFTNSIPMTLTNGLYVAKLPTSAFGTIYYYIKLTTDSEVVTKPYYIQSSIPFTIDDGSNAMKPYQVVITPGTKQFDMGFNWLTQKDTGTIVQYRKVGESRWREAWGTCKESYITDGWDNIFSHKATVKSLTPDAMYEYRVGNGTEWSSIYTFKAPTNKDKFSFLLVSDPQNEEAEGFEYFAKALDHIKGSSGYPKIDFILITGDIVQNGYKATEWEACFEVLGEYFATIPVIALPGNHENKGNFQYVNFAARFNLPGGMVNTTYDGTTAWLEYGDACITVLNSEPYPPEQKPQLWSNMADWAQKVYMRSEKKWRIMATHAGPYTSDHPGSDVAPLADIADNLKVDLFVNGHDHQYIRGTVINRTKVQPGEGTTYVTAGTIGDKFYTYVPSRSDPYTEVQWSDVDGEERQNFNIITVGEDEIECSMYLLDPMDEVTEEYDYNAWTRFDHFIIPESLSDYEDCQVAYYTVVYGDWLSTIASKCGLTWKEMAKLNNLENPDLVYPGQLLRVK